MKKIFILTLNFLFLQLFSGECSVDSFVENSCNLNCSKLASSFKFGANFNLNVEIIKEDPLALSLNLKSELAEKRYILENLNFSLSDFIKDFYIINSINKTNILTDNDFCSIFSNFIEDLIYDLSKSQISFEAESFDSKFEKILTQKLQSYSSGLDLIKELKLRTVSGDEIEKIKAVFLGSDKYKYSSKSIEFLKDFFKKLMELYYINLLKTKDLREYLSKYPEFKDTIKLFSGNNFFIPFYTIKEFATNMVHFDLGEINRENLLGRHTIGELDSIQAYLENSENGLKIVYLNNLKNLKDKDSKIKGKISTVFPEGMDRVSILNVIQNPDEKDIIAEDINKIFFKNKNFYILGIKENPFLLKTVYPLFKVINLDEIKDDDIIDLQSFVIFKDDKSISNFPFNLTKKNIVEILSSCKVDNELKITAEFKKDESLSYNSNNIFIYNLGRCLDNFATFRKGDFDKLSLLEKRKASEIYKEFIKKLKSKDLNLNDSFYVYSSKRY